MEDQFWNLFRETGDPMGYLLYKAEQKKSKPKPKPQKPRRPADAPPAKL